MYAPASLPKDDRGSGRVSGHYPKSGAGARRWKDRRKSNQWWWWSWTLAEKWSLSASLRTSKLALVLNAETLQDACESCAHGSHSSLSFALATPLNSVVRRVVHSSCFRLSYSNSDRHMSRAASGPQTLGIARVLVKLKNFGELNMLITFASGDPVHSSMRVCISCADFGRACRPSLSACGCQVDIFA